MAITLMVRDLGECVITYFTKKKRKYIKVGHFPPFAWDFFFLLKARNPVDVQSKDNDVQSRPAVVLYMNSKCNTLMRKFKDGCLKT